MNSNTRPMAYTVLLGGYMGLLLMSAVHGAKLVQFGPLHFDGGAITFGLTFILTDIVSEVYGKRAAIRIVLAGFFALIASMLVTLFAMALPASTEWTMAQEYETVLGVGARTIIAGIITFGLSQAVDLWLFAWLRNVTQGKYLWLRNNVSTIVGSGVDSVVFTTIAFLGIFPILPVILSAWVVRIILSLLNTPLVYLAVFGLRRFSQPRPAQPIQQY